MFCRLLIIMAVLSLSACSSWVFRYDIAQGNYLEQKSIDKLQVGMTKEQVKFILGSPVVIDAFSDDTWNYVYTLKSGRDSKFNRKKHFILNFSDDLLISAEGDYKVSENFNTPFNESTKTNDNGAKD
jgi:outer membrane protein assembly factor BamE